MAPDRALNCESEAWVAHRSTSVSRPGVCIVSITAAVVGICAACVVSSLSECGYFLSHSAECVDTGSGGSWWLSCDMPAPTRGGVSRDGCGSRGVSVGSQRPLVVGLAMRFRSRRHRWRSFQAGSTLISRSRVCRPPRFVPSYGPGVRGKIPRRPRRPRLVLTSVAAHVQAVPAHARSTGWPDASWTRRAKPLQSREPRAGTG